MPSPVTWQRDAGRVVRDVSEETYRFIYRMLKRTNIFLGSLDPGERIRYFLQTTAMAIVCVRLVYLDPKGGDGSFL